MDKGPGTRHDHYRRRRVVKQGYSGAVDEQTEIKQRQETYARALSVASLVPVILKIDCGDIQWMLDKATGLAIEKMGKVDPSSAPEKYAQLDSEIPTGAVDSTLALMLATGHLSNDVINQANTVEGGRFLPLPDGAFAPNSDDRAFSLRSHAYLQWAENGSPKTLLQNAVIDPCRSQWSSLGSEHGK